MVCSETRGSCGKDTMDVLHLHWVFIHLNAQREMEGGRKRWRERWKEGGREGERKNGGRTVGGW